MDQPIKNIRTTLTYDGRIGDLYGIFLVNLLLNIVTLGIWRFWAITRMRRYIWSRTSLLGDRFEYDGKGSELLVGFLIAMAAIIGIFMVAALLTLVLGLIQRELVFIPIALVYLAMIVLALGAPFSAQRYRLGHTVWRGIRGGMQGSMINYGVLSLLYNMLAGLTLFQLIPWASLRLMERRINASSFGSFRFTTRGRPIALYGRFLLTCIGAIVLIVAVFGALFTVDHATFAQLQNRNHPAADPAMTPMLGLHIALAYIVVILGIVILSANYWAAFFCHVMGNTRLGDDIAFSSDMSTAGLLRLQLGNILLLLVTLGLGYPVMVHRTVRFYTRHLLITGMLDLATLRQTELPTSRFGEGMFQALDAGSASF
jgi:uncharacterized membrane protein YjgN (DUF898 family)